ncbi:MAG TPA: ester cyclase [Anaerolineae bacterium]|nr:ester cyclase [Anaerolineae bacterium]MCB0179645.1 ester cyclase [Anaerolineae bacterium]MCB9103711.1 ester cyclase [Anaerolineales bacterium]HRV91808.1 ester cyclase [Anaerolineae bacterium]
MSLTPQENNDLAIKFFETAWNTGEIIEDLIDPQAVDHSSVGGKEKADVGRESFKKIIGMFRAAMPDIKLDVQDEIFVDDKVVHRWVMTGTDTGGVMGMPPSNKNLTFSGTTIVRFKDGKIVERWANVDELGLLQQLGVAPPPPNGN